MSAATAAAPTLSQIQAWSTVHLEAAAASWTQIADTWEYAFTKVHREALFPGGTLWEGAAAEAAALRTGTDRIVVVDAVDNLHSAASTARYGVEEITNARQLALQAVDKARSAGLTVGEDLAVTSQDGGPAAFQAARQAQARVWAATIRAHAEALVVVDTEVASKVSTAIAGVGASQFADVPVAQPAAKKKPQIQAASFGPKPESPIPVPGLPSDPAPTPSGPSGDDIRRVLEKLPEGDNPRIREVRSIQDLENLWKWMQQNGVERPGAYVNQSGVMKNLPDGTIVGRRDASGSTRSPALDVRIPGQDGYIKVHINPRGGVPEIPAPLRPAIPEVPVRGSVPPELPPAQGPIRAPAPIELPPLEGAPRIGGVPIAGGPGIPLGPSLVPPPHSIRHPPIAGEDDLDSGWEYE